MHTCLHLNTHHVYGVSLTEAICRSVCGLSGTWTKGVGPQSCVWCNTPHGVGCLV